MAIKAATPKAELGGRDPGQRQNGGDQIAGEMEGVRRQRVAALLRRYRPQLSRTDKIDANRDAEHDVNRPAGVDLDVGLHQPADRLADNQQGQAEKQAGFDQRRQRLELAMAIMMFGVGRLFRLPHRIKSQHGGAGVDKGVSGLGEQRQRAGPEPRRKLGDSQKRARGDRGAGGGEFAALSRKIGGLEGGHGGRCKSVLRKMI